MKCCFQIISAADGSRRPACVFERKEFAGVLQTMDFVTKEDYVLVLMEKVDSDWVASIAPMMTVATFIQLFAGVDHASEILSTAPSPECVEPVLLDASG